MKVILYVMDGCPHCKRLKEDLKKFAPSKSFVEIEKKHISSSAKEKHGIRVYPTLVFLTDDSKEIGKLEGYHPLNEVEKKYNGCMRLDKLFKRTGKLY